MTNLNASDTPSAWQSSPNPPTSVDEAIHQAGPDEVSGAHVLVRWLRESMAPRHLPPSPGRPWNGTRE